ncbi:MAG TPA: carboxypeptidase-like regulatory domain-containing protein, partial [Bacteroidales bacterium]|nr:carboxypeptidase-like regulatory domain-containing protein [Bacteroidales bacterium]
MKNKLKTPFGVHGIFMLLFLHFAISTVTGQAPAQQRVIRGTVVDTEHKPVPFANVLVKGSTIGIQTNEQGSYELSVNGDVTLIISCIGFTNQEINTEGRQQIDIVLVENSIALDEIVITGYSEVNRKHLASSIEVIDMDKVKTRPLLKLEEGFSGTVSGAYLMQGSNLPGSIPGEIRIRGLSTLQNASPLVIVDGMEQSLTDIDPNQIKSISVLKDAASASMYGSRGANGVIIIETERGIANKFKVQLHTWAAVQRPIDLPDFVNAADYMRLNNEAKQMQGQALLYNADDIMHAERGDDRVKYPDTDWLNAIMQRTAHSYNTSANISGGGGVGTFNLMLGYN